MEKKTKLTPPPFVNLMPYEVMRNLKSCINRYSWLSKPETQDEKSILDASDRSKSYLNSNKENFPSSLDARISSNCDVAHKSQCVENIRNGCYVAQKIIIDRAETLQTFLNETGSDVSDSCQSADSDSVGDDGYSTDSHNLSCPSTNLSSSSSSLVSADGDVASVVPKTGILKRSSDSSKKVAFPKRVTFVSSKGCKVGNGGFEKTLEQKIMALAIIDEEGEKESRLCAGDNILTASRRLSSRCRADVELTTNRRHCVPNLSAMVEEKKNDINVPHGSKFCDLYSQSLSPYSNRTPTTCKVVNRTNCQSAGTSISYVCNKKPEIPFKNMNEGKHKSLQRSASNNVAWPNTEPLHQSTFAKSSDILKLFQRPTEENPTLIDQTRSYHTSLVNLTAASIKSSDFPVGEKPQLPITSHSNGILFSSRVSPLPDKTLKQDVPSGPLCRVDSPNATRKIFANKNPSKLSTLV